MIANAAIVISCAKKAAAFSGNSILKRGRRITICYVSTISHTEFNRDDIPN